MEIQLWSLGKIKKDDYYNAIEIFETRLKHYTKFSFLIIDNSKINNQLSKNDILKQEAKLISEKLQHKDTLICLDEKGAEYTSVAFSSLIEKEQAQSTKLIFLIGGSYGIADEIKTLAKHTISFSKMTFPHQLMRLFFVEQLYRAFSILKNEKYHHD